MLMDVLGVILYLVSRQILLSVLLTGVIDVIKKW